MPIKLRPSIKKVNRTTKAVHTEHTYMKNQSSDALVKIVNDNNTLPKLRDKVSKELVRRKVSY